MKFKYLVLSLLLLILSCSAAIAAESLTFDDYSFNLPDGFSFVNQSEHVMTLTDNGGQSIVLANPDDDKSPDEFKKEMESKGCELGEEYNYTVRDYKIEQYNFKNGNNQGFLYVCHTGLEADDIIYITYLMPKDDYDAAGETNPVNAILDSLSKVDD